MQLALNRLVGELAAIHFQEIAGSREGSADAGKIRAVRWGVIGEREFWNRVALGRVLASEVKLALKILLSHFDVPQGHPDVLVTQQLHERGKADT